MLRDCFISHIIPSSHVKVGTGIHTASSVHVAVWSVCAYTEIQVRPTIVDRLCFLRSRGRSSYMYA